MNEESKVKNGEVMEVACAAVSPDGVLVPLRGHVRHVDRQSMAVEMTAPFEGIRHLYPFYPYMRLVNGKCSVSYETVADVPLGPAGGGLMPDTRRIAESLLARLYDLATMFLSRKDYIADGYRKYVDAYNEITGDGVLDEVREGEHDLARDVFDGYIEYQDRLSGTSMERFREYAVDLIEISNSYNFASPLTQGVRDDFRKFLENSGVIRYMGELLVVKELITQCIDRDARRLLRHV